MEDGLCGWAIDSLVGFVPQVFQGVMARYVDRHGWMDVMADGAFCGCATLPYL